MQCAALEGLKPQSVFPIDLNYIWCSSEGQGQAGAGLGRMAVTTASTVKGAFGVYKLCTLR